MSRRRQPISPEVTLARLVAETRDQNDLRAGHYDLVCARYFEVVQGVAHTTLYYSEADAQDAVSITWERLLNEWRRGRAPTYKAPVAVVVHTVAKWEARGVAQKRHTHGERMARLDAIHGLAASDSFRELEAIEWMKSLFAHLPPRDRQVAELRYLEEMPPAHIAEYLGVKPNAVHQAQHRGLQAIRLIGKRVTGAWV